MMTRIVCACLLVLVVLIGQVVSQEVHQCVHGKELGSGFLCFTLCSCE